ncbi:hypothetical protein A21D_00491 [Virgibacillus dokdonensis]|uniref:Uncharacterized protein n=1 Tax=Virgibacillus dokdonensis TaxID=302167 RepID=A0A2K9IW23_9BACI|nr:hypothetical protein A21D_00491 [Virgibacillus dokdonensis]
MPSHTKVAFIKNARQVYTSLYFFLYLSILLAFYLAIFE